MENMQLMKSLRTIVLILFITTIIIGCSKSKENEENMVPPQAEKIPRELTIHGHTRVDPYYWLNERNNPKVLEHLKAENAYRDTMLKPMETLQKKLYKEIISRIKQDDQTVPYYDNGYYYYKRYEKGEEYPVHARKQEKISATEEVMLNVPDMAKGKDYYHVTGLTVSADNRILAFGVDTLGRRRYTIMFKDLKTGKILGGRIENTTGHAVWANDNRTLFYTTKDSTLRAFKVWRHRLGTDPAGDEEIYHEKDNTFSVYAYKSRSDKYIILASYHTLSTEMRLLDADHPDKAPVVFHPRERDIEYEIFHHTDTFYILTNQGAENFRLMETDINRTARSYWREVIPHRESVLLENMTVFKNFLVLGERKDGIRQIRVIHLTDQAEHYLEFDEDVYVAYPTDNHVFDAKLLRYKYTSLTTPMSTYDYDMTTREHTLLKEEEVGGDFDCDDYISERLWVPARDGERVPVSLVCRKDVKKDGQHPLLLYGYGSYGASMDPYFSSARLSLLDRGFVFAIAHVRGGEELGRQWYKDGKLLNKKNTFTDFIDCAEFLVAQNYTRPEELFAMGGSAGGLLVGAVANMRPDLFRGIIAAVPWVDVVTTMLDESIPLTTSEFDEWGNPKNKAYYDYMLSYSPYDNVSAQDYPAMYVTTGLHDSQVQYFEPVKWVAKLRDLKTDDDPVILDVDMESGHGGASGRFKRYKRTAREYAFMLALSNMNIEKER
jgi:oligopeptidase B